MKKFIILITILSIICSVFGMAFGAVNQKDQYIGDILHIINKIEKDYRQEVDEEHTEERINNLEQDMEQLRELVYKYAWYLTEIGEYDSNVLNILYYIQLALNGEDVDKNFSIARTILDPGSAYVTFKVEHS